MTSMFCEFQNQRTSLANISQIICRKFHQNRPIRLGCKGYTNRHTRMHHLFYSLKLIKQAVRRTLWAKLSHSLDKTFLYADRYIRKICFRFAYEKTFPFLYRVAKKNQSLLFLEYQPQFKFDQQKNLAWYSQIFFL